jgi:hypothetical protein
MPRDSSQGCSKWNYNTPFYCYIVCDITPKMQTCAEFASLEKTPDGMGYFGYNKGLHASVEVISYDKLLGDAQKRNRILFEKLFASGIPETSHEKDLQCKAI